MEKDRVGDHKMKKTKSDIAAEYCINFSTVPSRTLAQKIKDEHPEMGGLEDIRSCVRYVRGRHGAGKQRVKWTDIKFNYNSGGLTDFGIPISESYNTTPVKFTTGKWLILADTQMPFHEAGAITRAIQEGKKHGGMGWGMFVLNHTPSTLEYGRAK